MNRREAISLVTILFGGTVIGANAFISGCSPSQKKLDGRFSPADVTLLDDVGETIIPDTAGSPGARSIQIGQFMVTMVTDCYDEKEQQIFIKGMEELSNMCYKIYNKPFVDLSATEKKSLLEIIDNEVKGYEKNKKENSPTHYFRMIKQLTVLGYFTSEAGATKARRYLPIPGKYVGIIKYKKGDKAWAT